MAKRHLKVLLRQLNTKYIEAEKLYTYFAEQTEHQIISEETMEPLTLLKIRIDNLLQSFSISIASALNKELNKLIKTEQTALEAFSKPLLQLLDNLSERPEDISIQELIKSYTEQIKKTKEKIAIIETVKFYAELPNPQRKSRIGREVAKKNLLNKVTKDLSEIDKAISDIRLAYDTFIETPILPSEKGDLDE